MLNTVKEITLRLHELWFINCIHPWALSIDLVHYLSKIFLWNVIHKANTKRLLEMSSVITTVTKMIHLRISKYVFQHQLPSVIDRKIWWVEGERRQFKLIEALPKQPQSKIKSNAQKMDVLSSSRSSELNEQCLNGGQWFKFK